MKLYKIWLDYDKIKDYAIETYDENEIKKYIPYNYKVLRALDSLEILQGWLYATIEDEKYTLINSTMSFDKEIVKEHKFINED